ncbi:MAG: hypothetical protein H7125_11205 [Proteobacteria bacterium]|nr:hypothetical protein [Burkholderiales bacterium]
MKSADLARLKGTKIMGQMKQERGAGRAADAPGAAVDKREQRRRDQAAGLVPFAVKLDHELIKQVTALAQSRKASLTDVVDELLRKALGEPGSK